MEYFRPEQLECTDARSIDAFATQARQAHSFLNALSAQAYPPQEFAGAHEETFLYVMDPSVRLQLRNGRKLGRVIRTAPAYLLTGFLEDMDGDAWRARVRSFASSPDNQALSSRWPYAWVNFTGVSCPIVFTQDGIVPDETRVAVCVKKPQRLSLENVYRYDESLLVPGYSLPR